LGRYSTRNGVVAGATAAHAGATFDAWPNYASVAPFAPVVSMDADVVITIALCVEVFLFGLAGALFIAHEVRRDRPQATANAGTKPRPIASAEPSEGLRA
jgi:hypothetical protein